VDNAFRGKNEYLELCTGRGKQKGGAKKTFTLGGTSSAAAAICRGEGETKGGLFANETVNTAGERKKEECISTNRLRPVKGGGGETSLGSTKTKAGEVRRKKTSVISEKT